jgi:hypothetical protein
MHTVAVVIGDVMQAAIALCIFVYAPFARSWQRGVLVTFFVALSWGILRMAIIIFFREPSPPFIAFLAVPCFCALYAVGARLLKTFLAKIPIVRRVGRAIQTKWKCQKNLRP